MCTGLCASVKNQPISVSFEHHFQSLYPDVDIYQQYIIPEFGYVPVLNRKFTLSLALKLRQALLVGRGTILSLQGKLSNWVTQSPLL